MPAAVENCLQNLALAVSAEENEEKYQLQGHRLSANQSQQLIINRQVLMVITMSTVQVMRMGNKRREEVLSLPV
jgi:thermostable 8-oxoguanine DNA glycosylase